MARGRRGYAVQSKIAMLLWGEQGTGKSTMALQSMYLKRPDGKPFRVLYIDPESGSIDDYLPGLAANGVNLDNIFIIYSQSLEEIRGFIKRATNNEPFFEFDDDGNETETMVLDADGEMFNPDMIVIDGTAVLYMTSQQGLINFSKKRAKVRATKNEVTGEARTVAIEGAGMEQKDWGTLKYKGQDLILDLTACGKHYIITAREKAEMETVKTYKNGKEETASVATGRKIPDSFSGVGYNVRTEIRMYRDSKDPKIVMASVTKDRTGVHGSGDTIEDPSLLDWQKMIDRTAGNAAYAVKNNLVESSKIEEELYTKSFEEPAKEANSSSDGAETLESIIASIREYRKGLSPVEMQGVKQKLEAEGLPGTPKSIKDVETAKAVAKVFAEAASR